MEDQQPLRNGSAHDSSGESDSDGQVTKEEEEKNGEEESRQSLIRGLWCCQQALAASSSESPRDKLFLVYLSLFLAGMGVLFPWNSFVSALDYFLFLYRSYHPEVAIPLIYLIITLAAMAFTIATINLFPLHGRIGFGYVMFFIALLFIPFLDIGIHNCTVSSMAGFFLTLLGVVLVGMGSGVQQSSLYGLAGILPGKRYTQALMAGESAAGITVALNRVFTKAAVGEERIGAIVFFIISLLFIILCVCCQVFLCSSPFVRFHLKHSQAAKRAEQQGRQQVISYIISSEDDEGKELIKVDSCQAPQQTRREKFVAGVKLRMKVILKLWKLLVTLFLIFKVTLLVFPGITTDVQYCVIKDWSPVILVLVFNTADFISRWIALLPITWKATHLVIVSLCRYLLVPLLVLCVSPSPTHPILPFPLLWAVVLVMIIGVTTGYFGTLPMIMAPKEVENEHRELAGTITAFFLLAGLTFGSVLAYSLVPLTELAPSSPCRNTTSLFNCTQ